MSQIQPHQPQSSFFKVQERDILAELLADKRSPNTRRAYARDLKDFFASITEGLEPSPQLVSEFLKLERFTAIGLVLNYKQGLIDKGLAEATVNRRLAAIKSLVSYAQTIGKCEWSLEEVSGERVQSYRDTSGIDAEAYRKLLDLCDQGTIKGLRDYAIFRLLWDNALRRDEICKCNVSDFDPESRSLKILGKGRGTQAETIDLSQKTAAAVWRWVQSRQCQSSDPLFVAVDRAHSGHRLTGSAIYNLVRKTAERAGIGKRMSPHRCRHSAITQALDLTSGDVRRVQKLSRHKNLQTLMVYDDHRQGLQGQVTDLLSEAIEN